MGAAAAPRRRSSPASRRWGIPTSESGMTRETYLLHGKDPVAQLEPIVQYVTGFCAKDCAASESDVMIQFGTGKVDFKAVLKVLKSAGSTVRSWSSAAQSETHRTQRRPSPREPGVPRKDAGGGLTRNLHTRRHRPGGSRVHRGGSPRM